MQPNRPESLFDKYLDRMTKPLIGTIDADRIEEIRSETLAHLEQLAEEIQTTPISLEEAAIRAMNEYGAPELLGLEFIATTDKGRPRSVLGPHYRAATLASFVGFGGAFGLAALTYEAAYLTHYPEIFRYVAAGLLGVGPVLGGVFAGVLSPTANLRSALIAMAGIGLVAYGASAQMASFHDPWLRVIEVVVYWVVVGCATMLVTTLLKRRAASSVSRVRRIGPVSRIGAIKQ